MPHLIERTDHLTELICEAVDVDPREHCAECGHNDQSGKLLAYFTKRGARSRQHDGLFCSKDCHDRYHGLKPRG